MNKIIYLDAAASYLKPKAVIDAEKDFLENGYANAGRGICSRAVNVDNLVNQTRCLVAEFINANVNQIVFTSGTTDGMSRVVNLALQQVKQKTTKLPVVAVSDLDHHSARLPWENMCALKKCLLAVMPLDNQLNIDASLVPYADIMVITAMSNVLGQPQNVKEIIKNAKVQNPNVVTIVDVAQFVVHKEIDVKEWGCDFLCFSGHKIGSDTGVGVLYIKNPDDISPDKFGGGMVLKVSNDKIIPNVAPDKFEAGTLPLTQIVGLKYAIESLKNKKTNLTLIPLVYDALRDEQNIDILTARDSVMFTFVPKNMHVLDFGALIGARNVCLRVGNMCASWIHKVMNVSGTVRISVGPWNTVSDMYKVAEYIKDIVK